MADDDTTLTADAANIAQSSNEFAFDLYERSSATAGNLFFSPSSIHTALSMAAAGANGNTALQMNLTLRFDQETQRTLTALQSLLSSINQSGAFGEVRAFDLVTANALWAQKGYPFQPAYVNAMRSAFGAAIESMDFTAAPEPSRQKINAWVAGKTNDRIKDLLPAGSVDPMTRLVLTNAIYFKAAWAQKFAKESTKSGDFHISATDKCEAHFMHDLDRYPYFENDQYQMLELPYSAWALSMLVVLPKKMDGLRSVERDLTAPRFAESAKQLQMHKIELSLPKYKFETSMTLNDTLIAMGMRDAFAPDKADFSAMSTAEKFSISIVLHKAYIDVNEEGTEAAAATAVALAGSAMPKPEDPVVFNANHPFFFAIRHNRTGAILFMGRVMDPSR